MLATILVTSLVELESSLCTKVHWKGWTNTRLRLHFTKVWALIAFALTAVYKFLSSPWGKCKNCSFGQFWRVISSFSHWFSRWSSVIGLSHCSMFYLSEFRSFGASLRSYIQLLLMSFWSDDLVKITFKKRENAPSYP